MSLHSYRCGWQIRDRRRTPAPPTGTTYRAGCPQHAGTTYRHHLPGGVPACRPAAQVGAPQAHAARPPSSDTRPRHLARIHTLHSIPDQSLSFTAKIDSLHTTTTPAHGQFPALCSRLVAHCSVLRQAMGASLQATAVSQFQCLAAAHPSRVTHKQPYS